MNIYDGAKIALKFVWDIILLNEEIVKCSPIKYFSAALRRLEIIDRH